MQLPSEPIGLGARWEQEKTREWGGIPIRFTQRYEVRELSARLVRLDVSAAATTPQQYVKIPNLPEGASAFLNSAGGTASGQVQLDTETLVRGGHLSEQANAALTVTLQGGQVMDSQMSSRRERSFH